MRINLSDPQSEVWRAPERFKVLVCGRRFGKTYLALTWLINNALNSIGQHYYLAPTHGQAKHIAWRLLKELALPFIKNKSESELFVEFKNSSVIHLKGVDNQDGLRGFSWTSGVLDEFAYMRKEVWMDAVRPATSDKQAPVMFITSPAGWNWSKEIYDYALLGVDSNWRAFSYTTLQGGNVTKSEIEAAKREMPPSSFRQEYEASFESLEGRVYTGFNRILHIIDRVDTQIEIHVGMDFNVNPMTAVVGVKVANQLHIVDEIVLPNSNTAEMAKVLGERYSGHKVYVYPDPSGKSRKTSASVGVTDFTILSRAGFEVRAPSKAPPVVDRLNEVNALFSQERCFIDKKCIALIKALDGLVYKEGTSMPDKSGGHDHITDALGYLIHYLHPIQEKIKPINVEWSL